MAQIRQAALDHEARRWLRPDWRRFWRPGSENDPLYKFYARVERKYDSGQPRVPAGVPEGGAMDGRIGYQSVAGPADAGSKPRRPAE